MLIHRITSWLITLLVLSCMLVAHAQTSLTLTYGNPTTSPDSAFGGTVFQAGTEVGDAFFYAKFGGVGTRYFEIDSPGDSTTKKVSSDGFVTIRPLGSMVIDQTKIKAFSGPISGSIVITAKPLSITTLTTSVTTEVVPGSEITINYRTGAGTFPAGLIRRSFNAQLLDTNGLRVADLQNVADQYIDGEQAGASLGGIRSIKAVIPLATSSGSYRVRVSTQGLLTNVFGSSSSLFTVKANSPVSTAIAAGSVTGNYCPGATVSFPFSTTGTFPSGNSFRVQLVTGSSVLDLSGTGVSSPLRATLPTSLSAGAYRFQIVATATSVQSNTSTVNVSALATLTISGSSTVTAGTTAPIRFDFTGTAPWSFTYTDNGTSRSIVSSVNSSTITPTFLASTTYDKSFIKTFRDEGCGLSTLINGSAQITVIPLTVTTGTLSGTYCPGSTIPVSFTTSGTLPAGLSYQAQLSDEMGNFLNAQLIGIGLTSPISGQLPTTLVGGTGYRIQVVILKPTTPGTVDYSGLANPIASPLVISRPDAPTVGTFSVCSGTTATPLSATGVNLKWYTSSTSSQSLASAPTPSTTQSSIYYVSQTINGCESLRQPVSVSVVAIPPAPSVSSVTLCQGTQGQFSASIPNALWYTSATGGTPTSQPPTLNNQTAGDQTVYVTQTVNGCESPRAAVKATVSAIPIAPTLPISLSLCQFSAANSLTATGTNLTWYNQSGKLTGVPTPSTSLSGVQSYSVSQTINTCESPKAIITVVILAAPDAPVVTASRYCVNESPRSLTATGTNLKWYTAASGGTASGTSPTYLTESATTFTFYVTQTDAYGCESMRQPISVSVIATPQAPMATNITLCQGTSGQFSTSIPNALWYTSATGGTPTSQPPTLNNQTAGDQTVYVTQTVNGCESPRTAVKATVYPIPVAPLVQSPTYVCQFSLASSLTATGSNLSWYNQAGKLPGAPTPNSSLTGVQSYSISQTINSCESTKAVMSVVVRSAPSMPTANSVRYCIGDVPRSLTTTGSNPRWYVTSAGGTSSNTSPAFFTETATVLTFYVTQTDSSGCESLRQPVSVSVVAPPTMPTVTANQLICQSSKVGSLTASPNAGLLWQSPGSTVTSETAPTPVTSQPGTFTYLVSQKSGTCISPKAQIIVTVASSPPAPGVQSPVAFCIGTTSIPLSATGSTLSWYTTADHSGPLLSRVFPNTAQANITTYYVTQKDANNCESLNSLVEVRVSTKATATLSGDGEIYPGDSTAIRVRLTGDAPWTFTDWASKLITIPNPKDSLYIAWVRPRTTTTYLIKNLTSACGPGDAGAPYILRVNIPLGSQSTLEPLSVVAYPNPTSGELSVNWSSPTRQQVTLQILSTTGMIIREVTRSSSSTPQTETFQLGSQAAGLYFLQVKTPTNGLVTKSIVKH